MSQQLIDLNPDLQKLQSEGLELEVHGGLLYVRHVPYLDSTGTIKAGDLIFTIETNGQTLNLPKDHTAHWKGEKPCDRNGVEVPSLINSFQANWNGIDNVYFLSLMPDSLGNKYPSHYSKVSIYYSTIAGHALSKDRHAAKKVRCQNSEIEGHDVLVYQDTNASKSGIMGIAGKIANQKVAIIGLGGTGGYLLDLLAKTPVQEIHLFDDDIFSNHNAFRAPGAPTLEDLNKFMPKVEYFKAIYSRMHNGISAHNERVSEANITFLANMDMVFICVDSVVARNFISRHLMDYGVKFVDSGLGLFKSKELISGLIRSTTFDGTHGDHVSGDFGTDEADVDEVYNTNIQIAELNNLAAIMMVIKWKQLYEFYDHPDVIPGTDIYNVSLNKIVSK